MNFAEYLNTRKKMIEEALEQIMPPAELYPPVINQAMRYAVFNGGKRLRPILLLEGASVIGGDISIALPAACAVEMIHSYSLVHDDLPAMDDDDFRRGKPTCHKVYGEANAILAGDGLLTLAFEVLASMAAVGGIKPENLVKVIGEIARAAGNKGMIAGQVVDLESEGRQIDEDTLKYMHRNKTGALFTASLKAGAMLFGAHEDQLRHLEDYAEHFGLAFQITDDILDIEGSQEEIGKPIGSDIKNEKSTFVSLYGLEESRSLAQEQVRLALESLSGFGSEAEFLRELAHQILYRRS
ncbi:MAG: polyprenyl synthetase family protein [Candidatus Saccharibacteria bacterium]